MIKYLQWSLYTVALGVFLYGIISRNTTILWIISGLTVILWIIYTYKTFKDGKKQ